MQLDISQGRREGEDVRTSRDHRVQAGQGLTKMALLEHRQDMVLYCVELCIVRVLKGDNQCSDQSWDKERNLTLSIRMRLLGLLYFLHHCKIYF